MPVGGPPDTLIVDIWAKSGPRAELDVLRIQKNVHAGLAGWWGQEINLFDWIVRNCNGRNLLPIRREQFAAYERHLGFRLIGANHSLYPAMVRMAVDNLLATLRQQERAGGGRSIRDGSVGSAGSAVACGGLPGAVVN